MKCNILKFDIKNLIKKKIHLGGSFFLFNFIFVAFSFLVLFYLIYLMSNSGTEGIVCIYKSRLGIECPTCGYTRSFIHYLKFDFQAGIGQMIVKNTDSCYVIFPEPVDADGTLTTLFKKAESAAAESAAAAASETP